MAGLQLGHIRLPAALQAAHDVRKRLWPWRLAVAVSNEVAWRQGLVMWRLSWQGSQLQRAGFAAVVCAYMHTPY